MKATENTTTITTVFCAVWDDGSPRVKVFATRAAAEDWAKGFNNVWVEEEEVLAGDKEVFIPVNPYSCDNPEICTDCNTEILLGRCNQCS